jgi:hypothetical protein
MKPTLITCCALLLLTPSLAFSQAATGNAAAEASLQKMETELAQAGAKHDTAPFNKYLDEHALAWGPGWHADSKADVLQAIKSTDCTLANPTLTSFATRWVTADVALLSYMESSTLTCQGKSRPVKERDSSLWQKKNGHWTAVFHQVTAEEPATGAQ